MSWYKRDTEGNIELYFSPDVTTLPAGYDPAEWTWTDEDIIEVGGKLYLASDAPLQPDALETQFSAAIEGYLNQFAAQKYYDSIQNAMLMISSSEFTQDGKDAYAAYDDAWVTAISIMPQVLDGTLPIDEAMTQMPPLTWADGGGIQPAEPEADEPNPTPDQDDLETGPTEEA